MAFDIKGKIHTILETKQISDKFSKRDFVVETEDGKYPQLVSFQVVNDKIDQLNHLKVGDEVTVSFNVRGREWKSPSGEVKFFNTLDAWKVIGPTAAASRGSSHEPAPQPSPPVVEDKIPF